MNNQWLIFLLSALAFFSCNEHRNQLSSNNSETRIYAASEILEKNLTPTVDIKKYTLISASDEDRKQDAAEILRIKRKWPLVMQSPTSAAFDSILSKNFTFMGDGHLLNRADYIKNRTAPSEWKITHVTYDNLTLQFFGDLALLTYRNQVTNENKITKEIEVEHITWADVYIHEDGSWKISSAHVVDFRLETKK